LDLHEPIASGGDNGPEWFKDRGIMIIRKAGTTRHEALPDDKELETQEELDRLLGSLKPPAKEEEILFITDGLEIESGTPTCYIPPGKDITIDQITRTINLFEYFAENARMPEEL